VDLDPAQRARREKLAVASDRDLLRRVSNALVATGGQVLDAPHEADGQLAHLSRIRLIDVVIERQ
jgi:hypothetical protein